jgi:hypothetical protein
MKLFKVFFQFYINSSCHVALSAVAFTCLTGIELRISTDFFLLFFVFFATVLGYNFVKYLGFIAPLVRPESRRLKGIGLMTGLAAVTLPFFIMKFSLSSVGMVIAMGILTFFYAMPLSIGKLNKQTKLNLRGLSGVKIFVIALVWAVTTVLLPALEEGMTFSTSIFKIVVQRFLWVLVLMIPFEIRDLKYDHVSLATWPQNFGVPNTKILGGILLSVILLLEIFLGQWPLGSWFWILLFMVFLTAALIFSTKREQSLYYSAFWVEGLPVLWLGLVLLFG